MHVLAPTAYIVNAVAPISTEIHALLNEDADELDRIIHTGGLQADEIAQANVDKIKRTIGIV